MPSSDLVVVLPGIMGSTLSRHGKPVWSPSGGALLQAIASLGRNLKALRLPDGIGDEHPDDGVEPTGLMPDLHAIPGIWTPLKGYGELLKRLRSMGHTEERGNLLPVPYDWRLSNRYNGKRLVGIVEPALERWRAAARENEAARLVFVCHSMGGLVARWYLEKHGGAELTRKLITMGTPYRGAAKAVEQLVNGVRKGLGPLAIELTPFARSMPSLHQLLPEYACIDRDGALLKLTETAVPELGTAMTRDAMAFHRQLADAEAARPGSLAMTHAIVGVRQPTWTSLRVNGNRVDTLDTIDGTDHYGDGTVPRAGAIGHGQPMDTNTVRRIVDQHGSLQCNPYALDEVQEIVTAEPVRLRAGHTVPLRVTVPDVVVLGERLPVSVVIDADARDAVVVSVVNEGGKTVFSRRPRATDRRIDTGFDDLPAGGYEVRVTGVHTGSPVTPVTAPVLVWDPAAAEA